MTSEQISMATWAPIISLRRSKASASTPAPRAKSTRGIRRAAPIMPRASSLPVSV